MKEGRDLELAQGSKGRSWEQKSGKGTREKLRYVGLGSKANSAKSLLNRYETVT